MLFIVALRKNSPLPTGGLQ